MQNYAQTTVNTETIDILLAGVDITAATTTLAFDLTTHKVFQVLIKSTLNGGAGTLDYQVNYSPTDAVDGGGLLVNPTALPLDYQKNNRGDLGVKNPALDFASGVLETQVLFEKPNLGVAGVPTLTPNQKFSLTLTPTGLTGVNRITVLIVKYNNK